MPINAIAEASLYQEGASHTDLLPNHPIPSRWYSFGAGIQVVNHEHIATSGMVNDT